MLSGSTQDRQCVQLPLSEPFTEDFCFLIFLNTKLNLDATMEEPI